MLKEKAKFAHSERNHDPAQPLPFKGEGVRVNSESPCEGQTPALNTNKKKSKYYFGGWEERRP